MCLVLRALLYVVLSHCCPLSRLCQLYLLCNFQITANADAISVRVVAMVRALGDVDLPTPELAVPVPLHTLGAFASLTVEAGTADTALALSRLRYTPNLHFTGRDVVLATVARTGLCDRVPPPPRVCCDVP